MRVGRLCHINVLSDRVSFENQSSISKAFMYNQAPTSSTGV